MGPEIAEMLQSVFWAQKRSKCCNFWALKLQESCNFWALKLQESCNLWAQKLQLCYNMISGHRNCRNAAISGPRNCGYAREILYGILSSGKLLFAKDFIKVGRANTTLLEATVVNDGPHELTLPV